jgi:hypothetical protein
MRSNVARYVLESLSDLHDSQLEALAADFEGAGGSLHVAIGEGIRQMARSDQRRTVLASLHIEAARPDRGEVERLVAELSDDEPWRVLREHLKAPPEVFEIASEE